MIKLKNIIFDKLKINKISTKGPDQKYKIKIIRTEVEILTTERAKLYFLRDKKGKKKKAFWHLINRLMDVIYSKLSTRVCK
jgi:ribosomal protein L19